jgi:hypothetical protein
MKIVFILVSYRDFEGRPIEFGGDRFKAGADPAEE